MLPLSVVIVWAAGRGELKIAEGELYIRGAHLPLRSSALGRPRHEDAAPGRGS